jgi:hypothetical protein
MANTQPTNLSGIERGWRHLMKAVGRTLPEHANRNRYLIAYINSRMKGR